MVQQENYKGFSINIEQDESGSIDCPLDLFIANNNAVMHKEKVYDYEKFIVSCEDKNWMTIPIFSYQHGGIELSTTPYNDQWDSGVYGVITIKNKPYSDATEESIMKDIESTIESTNKYFCGEVYGYDIIDEDGDSIDSCWGFIGEDNIKDIIKDCKDIIDNHIKSLSHTYTLIYWYRDDEMNLKTSIVNVFKNYDVAVTAMNKEKESLSNKINLIFEKSNVECISIKNGYKFSEDGYDCGEIYIVDNRHKTGIVPNAVSVCVLSYVDAESFDVEVKWCEEHVWSKSVEHFKRTCDALSTDEEFSILSYILENTHNEDIVITELDRIPKKKNSGNGAIFANAKYTFYGEQIPNENDCMVNIMVSRNDVV